MVAVPKPVRIYSKEYREWVMRFPCVVCHPWSAPTDEREPTGAGRFNPSDPAHVHGRGAGGDDPGNIIPLCRGCHDRHHARGWDAIGLTRAEAAGLAWRYWVSYRVEPAEVQPAF